jgi:anti-sigma factor RsiW
MNCSVDVKAFALGEVGDLEKAACEQHLAQCQDCRDEVDRLHLTQSALLALPDEEVPRRIAFVSDRVFEPRWWQTMWRSGPVMGFASAAMLAFAILAHGYVRPAPVFVTAPTAQIDTASIERNVDKRIQSAVAKAVVEIEAQDAARSAKLLDAAEKRYTVQQNTLTAASETIRLYQQQMGRMMYAMNDRGSQ